MDYNYGNTYVENEGIVGFVTNDPSIKMTDELRKHCLELYNQTKNFDEYEAMAVLSAISETKPMLLAQAITEYIEEQENFKTKFNELGGNV